MYTREHAQGAEINPGFADLCLVDGKVWLSQQCLDDLEDYTGLRPDTQCPRELLMFLREQARLFKRETRSEELARHNFLGYCLVRHLQHALDLRMHGAVFAGELPTAHVLYDAFHADCLPLSIRLQ